MNQAIEIANVNARYLRKEITEATRLKLIFEIRERYEKIMSARNTDLLLMIK